MSTDTSEIKAYKLQIAAAIIIFVVGTLTEYKADLVDRVQAIWDVSKRPCQGSLTIDSPLDGSNVSGVVIKVSGTAKHSLSCRKVILFVEPFSGGCRGCFVSDWQLLRNGEWTAHARIDEIPKGQLFRVMARMCPDDTPYPEVGCVQGKPLYGVASNAITLRRVENVIR